MAIFFSKKKIFQVQKEGRNNTNFLPIGRNKIVNQENKYILDDILVLLFNWFVIPFPRFKFAKTT